LSFALAFGNFVVVIQIRHQLNESLHYLINLDMQEVDFTQPHVPQQLKPHKEGCLGLAEVQMEELQMCFLYLVFVEKYYYYYFKR
jgi:hypothetical protein